MCFQCMQEPSYTEVLSEALIKDLMSEEVILCLIIHYP